MTKQHTYSVRDLPTQAATLQREDLKAVFGGDIYRLEWLQIDPSLINLGEGGSLADAFLGKTASCFCYSFLPGGHGSSSSC